LKTRFIDSNIFIYVLLKDPRYGKTALQILERIERGEERGLTSTLTLTQVYAHLIRRKKGKVIAKVYEYLDEAPIDVIDTKYDDFKKAFELRKEKNLPWEMWDDLVIASQMMRAKVEEIYSNDEDFDKIPGVKRIFT